MVGRSSSLLRLVPLALLFVVGSCSHARPRPSLADREAQCAPVWKAVHAEIDARGAACSADWECREFRPEYLGCDAWANVDFRLSEARVVELEKACAPISFVPDCGQRVGACVAGRCSGRGRLVDPAVCARSKQTLDARLAAPFKCSAASDCASVMVRGLRGPGPSDWERRYAAEVAAIAESCTPDQDGPLPASLPVATCVAERCQLRPGDEVGRPPLALVTKPRFADPRCVSSDLRIPKDLAGLIGTVTVSFTVSTRGVPYAFEIFGTSRKDLMSSLSESVSGCPLIPATKGDVPIEMRLLLPLRFRPGF